MAFYGDLEDVPLHDILYVLTSNGKSGVLTLSTPMNDIQLVIDRSTIASVSATDGSLRIGHLLVSQGYVTREQVEQALGMQAVDDDSPRIGDLLIEAGFVSPERVQSAFHAQLEASLFRILVQNGGTFSFENREHIDRDPITSNVRIESMVLNAMRLADEWREIHDPEVELFLTDDLIDVSILSALDDPQRQIMMAVLNGHNTIDALAIHSRLTADEFQNAVNVLQAHGLIRQQRRGQAVADSDRTSHRELNAG